MVTGDALWSWNSVLKIGWTCRQKCSDHKDYWNINILELATTAHSNLNVSNLCSYGKTYLNIGCCCLAFWREEGSSWNWGWDPEETKWTAKEGSLFFFLKHELFFMMGWWSARTSKLPIPQTALGVCTPSARLLTSASPSAPTEHHSHFLSGSCPKISF